MFYVDNNDIFISKGNSAAFKANLTEDGEPYELKDGDVLTLTAEKDGAAVLQLTANAEGVFSFEPSATSQLEAGDYSYDLKLTAADGFECNPIPLSAFTILKVAEAMGE